MKIFQRLFSSKSSAAEIKAGKVLAAVSANDPGENAAVPDVRAEVSAMLKPVEENVHTYRNPRNQKYLVGDPTITGEELLAAFPEQIQRIRSGAGLAPADFNRLVWPILVGFAEFVHVLPASQAHHHKSELGLLAHSLDVACRAVNSSQMGAFDVLIAPSKRTLRRERWYVAVIIAGLLHDAGKPLTDYKVHDDTHANEWTGNNTIAEWAVQCGIKNYFISWNKERGEKHKSMSPTLVERLVTQETRDWLREGGQDLYFAMVDAIAGTDPKAQLTSIVIKADSSSVAIDLKTVNNPSANNGGLAVNVASIFHTAARWNVEKEIWKSNQPGARVWVTTQGVFLVWKGAVDEVVAYLDAHKTQGMPRGTETLGNALVDHGVLEPAADGDIYWSVTPDLLCSGDGKSIKLKCVKVIEAQTLFLYDLLPPAVAVVIGEGENAVRYDPEGGGMAISMAPATASGQPADINAPGGAVAPMFSLDSSAPAPAQAPQLKLDSGSENSKPMAPASSGPTISLGVVDEKPGITLGVSATNPSGKSDISKAALPPGVSLEITAGPTKPAGLVIGTGGSEDKAASQAMDVLKARVSGGEKGSSDRAGGKKSKGQNSKAKDQSKNLPAELPVPSPVLQAKQETVVKPLANEVSPYTTGVDPFANLTGISLFDPAEVTSEVLTPVVGEWVDPFEEPALPSSVAVTQVDDPSPRPQPVAAVKVAEPVLEVHLADGLGDDFDLPGEMSHSQPDAADADPLQSSGVVAALPMFDMEQRDEDLGLGDFDDDIKGLVGMPVPTYLKQVEARAAQQKVPEQADYKPSFVVPDEFRFDDDPGLPLGGIRDIPLDSPSGLAPAPADIEIRVREMSSKRELDSLVEVPTSGSIADIVPPQPHADLSDFDLPEFSAGIVLGAVSSIEVMAVAPAVIAPCVQVGLLPPTAAVDASAVVVTPSKAPKEKAKPIAKRLKQLPVGDIQFVNRDGESAESEGKTGALVVAVSAASPVTPLKIGSEVHDKSNSAKPKAPFERRIAVLETTHTGIRTDFTEEDRREMDAYLRRTPELLEKLMFYVADHSKCIHVKNFRAFLPFVEGGFHLDDMEALHRALWLWNDFTVDPMKPDSWNRKHGVLLSTYLAECLCHLTGGAFSLARYYPVTDLSFQTQFELAARLIEGCPKTKVVKGQLVANITTSYLKKMVQELSVSELDLRMALTATHDAVPERENLLVKLDPKDSNYE